MAVQILTYCTCTSVSFLRMLLDIFVYVYFFPDLLFSALLWVTVFNYILSLIAVVLCFVFYTTSDGCFLNKFFISFNMLFCMVASVISVLKRVQVQDTNKVVTRCNNSKYASSIPDILLYFVCFPRSLSHAQVFSNPPSSPCTLCF